MKEKSGDVITDELNGKLSGLEKHLWRKERRWNFECTGKGGESAIAEGIV